MELLESIDGPMTLGDMIWSLRSCDEISQAEFAKTLGVSSAVAKALGLIGDKDSIPSLKKIAADDSRQKITRAFACVALGIVGEKTDLPWNAAISANNNYRAKVSSIEEVLDIL